MKNRKLLALLGGIVILVLTGICIVVMLSESILSDTGRVEGMKAELYVNGMRVESETTSIVKDGEDAHIPLMATLRAMGAEIDAKGWGVYDVVYKGTHGWISLKDKAFYLKIGYVGLSDQMVDVNILLPLPGSTPETHYVEVIEEDIIVNSVMLNSIFYDELGLNDPIWVVVDSENNRVNVDYRE